MDALSDWRRRGFSSSVVFSAYSSCVDCILFKAPSFSAWVDVAWHAEGCARMASFSSVVGHAHAAEVAHFFKSNREYRLCASHGHPKFLAERNELQVTSDRELIYGASQAARDNVEGMEANG